MITVRSEFLPDFKCPWCGAGIEVEEMEEHSAVSYCKACDKKITVRKEVEVSYEALKG